MEVFLSLLFVLHVADARWQVPEADIGVLRLKGHTDDKISEEQTAIKCSCIKQ